MKMKHQNVKISSLPPLPYYKKMWPNVREGKDDQNYHFTQIPLDVEVVDGFAMNYHIVLFFNLYEVIIPKKKTQIKIAKCLDNIKILLGDKINDLTAIMYKHRGKQW